MKLSDQDLEELFNAAESERMERKASLVRDKICQAVCAFSNDLSGSGKPGVIFIGQNDDLSCAHLSIEKNMLETIGGWRADGKFQPFPTMFVEERNISGCPLIVVTVLPHDNTPMRYDSRVWIRVGPRRAEASANEERILSEKRKSRSLPFDALPVPDAVLDDIDLVRFGLEYLPAAVPADVLAQNGRTLEEQLRALRLLDAAGHPTATAVLVLGKSPQTFFPGAYVQMLRINGDKLTDDIQDQHRITGALSDQIRKLDEIIDVWITRSSLVGGTLRQDTSDYPLVALRQLVRNALMHRTYEATNSPVNIHWYNDRIEIHSPGGLYGQVSPETFGQPGVTDYRNPTLAEAFRNLGFAERFGVGIQIARSELERNGNPPLEFDVRQPHVLVTVRRAQ